MLRTLRLSGYRGFADYRLAGCTRVNLLVGKNNSGKTSILEAIQTLVSRGDPRVLARICRRRGEQNVNEEPDTRSLYAPDVSHHFFGHEIEPGAAFHISSKGPNGSLTAIVEEADPDSRWYRRRSEDMGPVFQLTIKGNATHRTQAFPLLQDGSLLLDLLFPAHPRHRKAQKVAPVQLLTLDPASNSLGTAWEKVVRTRRKDEVVAAMRILEPDLQEIEFATVPVASRGYRSLASDVLVGFPGLPELLPLGSCGDGMRRLFELSVSLVETANGILLVDEIDTGLHWTTIEEMWKLVVATAMQSGMQIFATTHSQDCVHGLATLLEALPELRKEVSLQKIESTLGTAVHFDADDIRVAAAQRIELR